MDAPATENERARTADDGREAGPDPEDDARHDEVAFVGGDVVAIPIEVDAQRPGIFFKNDAVRGKKNEFLNGKSDLTTTS